MLEVQFFRGLPPRFEEDVLPQFVHHGHTGAAVVDYFVASRSFGTLYVGPSRYGSTFEASKTMTVSLQAEMIRLSESSLLQEEGERLQ